MASIPNIILPKNGTKGTIHIIIYSAVNVDAASEEMRLFASRTAQTFFTQ